MCASIIHDYGGTVVILAWLFLFLHFSASHVLKSPQETEVEAQPLSTRHPESQARTFSQKIRLKPLRAPRRMARCGVRQLGLTEDIKARLMSDFFATRNFDDKS